MCWLWFARIAVMRRCAGMLSGYSIQIAKTIIGENEN
jgi:hypothetical protein